MKPVIKVWCLPHDQSEESYVRLQLGIVNVVIACGIGVKDQNDMVVLLPPDLMKKGLGEEIIVEIDVYNQPWRRVSNCIRDFIMTTYPSAYVQVKVTYTASVGGQVYVYYIPS
jgi:hypothetical protein